MSTKRERRDDRGEGVISAAIAVLVMAAIGALMWVGFRSIWQDAEANTREKVAEIGQ
jgi:type II secretory pathway component PulK